MVHRGGPYSIGWSSSDTSGNVKIELLKGGGLCEEIVISTLDEGSYLWDPVDPPCLDGADYQIRITDVTDSFCTHTTGEFSILTPLVRVAPVILQNATADPAVPYPGTMPPQSDDPLGVADPFYVEIWASNVSGTQPGLACVSEDVSYDTLLADAVPPVVDGPLFPINAVLPVFDDPSGLVDDVSGCQTIPGTDFLGVDEWTMVDRVEMTPADSGMFCVDLADAANIFIGVSLIGDPQNLDPAEVSYEFRCVEIGGICGDCPLDANGNTAIDTGDYAFFLSCFATCPDPSDPCICLDLNGNSCIDTGDYAGFLGCFAEFCPCPVVARSLSE